MQAAGTSVRQERHAAGCLSINLRDAASLLCACGLAFRAGASEACGGAWRDHAVDGAAAHECPWLSHLQDPSRLSPCFMQVPVKRVEKFGLIVGFTGAKDGLCHKSELDIDPNTDPSRYSEGQLIDVQLLEVPPLSALCHLRHVPCIHDTLLVCWTFVAAPGSWALCCLSELSHELLAGGRWAVQAVQESCPAGRRRAASPQQRQTRPGAATPARGRRCCQV